MLEIISEQFEEIMQVVDTDDHFDPTPKLKKALKVKIISLFLRNFEPNFEMISTSKKLDSSKNCVFEFCGRSIFSPKSNS